MPHQILYRGQFKNQEVNSANENIQQTITVDIEDTESPIVDAQMITELNMADTPLEIEVIDNDEDKFTSIRPKRAIIKVFSSDAIGIETFCDGGDKRYKVRIYSEVEILLVGYLSTSDLGEDLLPDPNTISLIAVDGLGYLAEEDLTDINGGTFVRENLIMDYLVAALDKTGNALPIVIAFNIREKGSSNLNDDTDGSGHFYKNIYLDAKTFEADINEHEAAQVVIEKILKREAFICQKNGSWWIIRIDEMQVNDSLYLFRFDVNGDFLSKSTMSLLKSVGTPSQMQWMNDDAFISTERAIKLLQLEYKYSNPKELVCNIDMDRTVETTPPTGAASETIDYTPECWDFLQEGTSGTNATIDSAPLIGSVGVLRKYYEFNYEKERYFVVENQSGFRHYFKSEGLKMAAKSKVSIGFNYRFLNDDNDTSLPIALVRLQGDDGNIYDWQVFNNVSSAWEQRSISDGSGSRVWSDTLAADHDFTEWRQMSYTSDPVPVSGTLYIRLMSSKPDSNQVWFNGLQVGYIPLLNGSYQKYTGQRHAVEQGGNYKGKIEDQVYISDAPDRNIKGALLKRGPDTLIFNGSVDFIAPSFFQISGDERATFQPYIGSTVVISGSDDNDQEAKIVSIQYNLIGDVTTIEIDGEVVDESSSTIDVKLATFVLAEGFYNAAVFPDGVPDETYNHPYGEIQAFDVWNQFNRTMRKFEGVIDHLQSGSEQPDLIHKYSLTDPNPNTNNKIFQLLHYKHEQHLCEWEAFFHEVHDSTISKQYLGHSFKYLTTDE